MTVCEKPCERCGLTFRPHTPRGRFCSIACWDAFLKANSFAKGREHGIWAAMIQRCTNPKRDAYQYYGGRGIRVCERWLTSFKAFLEDMGPPPSAKHSIDRINTEGHYEPGNCRWATMREQQRNRSNNRLITFRGETRCLSAWAESIGITTSSLGSRIERGWTLERALTSPVNPTFRGRLDDATRSEIVALARDGSLSHGAIARRFGITPSGVSRILTSSKEKLNDSV